MSEPIDADTIAENAAKPQSASGDGESVAQVPIQDQIAADKYRLTKEAQSNASSGWPVRYGTMRPPGTQ